MFTPVETGVVKKLGAGMADTFIVSHKEDAHGPSPQALACPITNLPPGGGIVCTLLDTTGGALSNTVSA